MKSAAIRAQVELALGSRFPSPFVFRETWVPETASTGIPELDLLTGGLPRGCLTEIIGPASSGRTTLALSILVEMTLREEVCALIDAQDALDPQSVVTAGADPQRLLWVRCGNIEQALSATDLLLQSGGFGLVAVDLADVRPEAVRRVPLSFWFRLRRAIENTPTTLVILGRDPCAKTCASLVLRLKASHAHWSSTFGLGKPNVASFPIASVAPPGRRVEHGHLLRGARLKAEVERSRLEQKLLRPSDVFLEVATAWSRAMPMTTPNPHTERL